MLQLKLYDSLSQTIKPLIPLSDNHIKLYCCGVTPYDASHLGHASVFLFYDALIRFLKYAGYKTTYVQNITDVDDSILEKARSTNQNWIELGNHWVSILKNDFEFLHMNFPDHMPKASSVISDIIRITESLQKKGLAYEVDGTVYFNVLQYKKYGQLSRFSRDEMLTIASRRGANIKDPNKKDPLDFVLWQPLNARFGNDEPHWDSPWGQGRPGWHIECSALSFHYLGDQIDIHGGGADLIFPHHESEIAQSENSTDKVPFVQHWLHSAMVSYKGAKMSKSLGNLVFISDLAKTYSANAIRWLLLSHQYRTPWEYVENELEEAQKIVVRIEKSVRDATSGTVAHDFIQALSNDFDSPTALQIMQQTTDTASLKEMWNLLGFI